MPVPCLSVEDAVARLLQGELIVLPTDTVFGLAADASQPAAIEKIFEAKGRDRDKPVAMLVSGREAAEGKAGPFTEGAARLSERFWPGPLTLVIPGPDGTDGFRQPDHPVALSIIEGVGGVIAATSANLSGEDTASTAAACAEDLAGSIAGYVEGGPTPNGLASTVVMIEESGPRMLREGAITLEEIESCLKK